MWWKEPQSVGQLEISFSSEGGWLLPEPHLGQNSLDFIPSHCLSHQQEAAWKSIVWGKMPYQLLPWSSSKCTLGHTHTGLPTSMEEPKQSCWMGNQSACSLTAACQIPLTVLGLCLLLTTALNKREFCILFSKKVFNTQLYGENSWFISTSSFISTLSTMAKVHCVCASTMGIAIASAYVLHMAPRPVHQYLISRWWYTEPELVRIKVRVYRLWCPFEKWYQSNYTLIRCKMSQRCQGYLLLKYNKWVSNVIILFGEKEWIPSCYPSVMVPRHLSTGRQRVQMKML